jgi:hypothetical protein
MMGRYDNVGSQVCPIPDKRPFQSVLDITGQKNDAAAGLNPEHTGSIVVGTPVSRRRMEYFEPHALPGPGIPRPA